jgi:peptide/nickel transport system ATP-binding protein
VNTDTDSDAGILLEEMSMPPLVEVSGLHFRYGKARVRGHDDAWTLRDLTLNIEGGSTLGVVGESGSGKSTLVRVLCGLLHPQQGAVRFDGRDIREWLSESQTDLRRRNQIVFQSPRRSLDPRMSIRRALGQPVRALERRVPSDTELTEWLERVGLGSEILQRYPHQLSGGQLQRVGIARAISVKPSVLYADEPVSALDVSVQAQVLNLLMDVRSQFGLTLVMVSHDLGVVSRLCEEVIVMKDGLIIEAGRTSEVLANPQTAYTESLVTAARTVSLAAPDR